VLPTVTATTDLGSSGLRFKDAYFGSLTTGTTSVSGTTAAPLTVSSTNTNPNITLQSTGVSGSVAGSVIFSGANENGFTVAGMFQNLAADGSSSIQFVTTPAGARNAYRGVAQLTVSGVGDVTVGNSLSATSGVFSGNVTAASVTTNNVAIKHKKITTTTDGAGNFNVAHGLAVLKILTATGWVTNGINPVSSSFEFSINFVFGSGYAAFVSVVILVTYEA
jgi:hypothetical protein